MWAGSLTAQKLLAENSLGLFRFLRMIDTFAVGSSTTIDSSSPLRLVSLSKVNLLLDVHNAIVIAPVCCVPGKPSLL